MKVSLAEAKERLEELIEAVTNGENVTICQGNQSVAELVRSTPSSEKPPESGIRAFGTLRGKIIEIDPDWWKSED